jgi:hypothetical protein
MTSRAEIATRYAKAYRAASKKDRGRLLDEVVSVTGWSRDNARRRLAAAAKVQPGSGRQVAVVARRRRSPKYSYDALKVLQRVWAASGGQCGKYLAESMPTLLDSLERHGELVDGVDRYSATVRGELLAMSAATIDRYLKGARAGDTIRGLSTTKPSPLLRSSITIRKAGDEVEAEPGFFEGDTVAHCGPTSKGEFARTVNLTCVHTGWVFTRAIRNNAHSHVLNVLQVAVEEIPFEVAGLDARLRQRVPQPRRDRLGRRQANLLHQVPAVQEERQATIESKNNHLVRRYGFYYRYDTPAELRVLNRLWPLVNDRLNFFTPTKKPIGWDADRAGRRRRVYDTPQTPLDRLLAAGVLAPEAELRTYRDHLNPADLARRIHDEQQMLIRLAKDKTEQLREATIKKLPDTSRGIRLLETS